MNVTQKARLSAMVGKKTKKYCPDCGAPMVVRQNKQDGSYFLGCNGYPGCKKTMSLSETTMMELSGAPTLFGDK